MNAYQEQVISEWTGIKGRIGGWYLNSPLRSLSETLLLGNCRASFMGLVSQIIMGNEVILDVGAGSGYFSLAVARKLTTGKVICLDLSDEMLQHLEQRAKIESLLDKIQLMKGEATVSGLASGSVDIVVSNGVFHELQSPEAALGEMLRVLKSSGWVFITDFRDTWLGKRIGAAHQELAHGPFSVEDIKILLNKVGLKNVEVSPVRHWVVGRGQKME